MKKRLDLITFTLGVLVATGTLVAAILLWPNSAPVGETSLSISGGTYRDITAVRLSEMLRQKDFVLINTHIPYEGEIAATDAFIPFDQIAQSRDRLPANKSARIVLYCRSGNMSVTAAKTLVQLGYTNVFNLSGGMSAWRVAGLPLIEQTK